MHINGKQKILLSLPLILSSFTHLWNPIGQFSPWFGYDEGIYMQRTMRILEGLGPQDYYDHPYFGQYFLGGLLYISGYPHFLQPVANNINSIEMLLFVPKVVMGILAIIDTYIIYMICKRHYNRNVGLIASTLFAVTPLSWYTRLILLDSIQLPILMSSILFALYINEPNSNNKTYNKSITLLSGIFLGLAIFTKIPAFIFIPLIAFVIFNNSGRNLRTLGLWLIPVIILPLIWPAYSIHLNHFQYWLDGIFFQTHREGLLTLDYTIKYNFNNFDPLLITFGAIVMLFAIWKRDVFVLLWIIPFIIFLYFIGFVQVFHILPIIPAFCIAISVLITKISKRISRIISKRISRIGNASSMDKNITQIVSIALSFAIASYGLVNTTILITSNTSAPYFEAAALVGGYFKDSNTSKRMTLISNPTYHWMLQIFFPNNEYRIYDTFTPIITNETILIADPNFLGAVYAGGEAFIKYYTLYCTNMSNTVIKPEQLPKDWGSSIYMYRHDSKVDKAYRLFSYNISSDLDYDGILLKPRTLTLSLLKYVELI